MSKQHRLHLFAFDVTEPPIPQQPVYAFMLPESWRKLIWPFFKNHKKKVILQRLRAELLQLYPSLFYAHFAEKDLAGHKPILIADEPIEVEVLAHHFTRHLKQQQSGDSFIPSEAKWTKVAWNSLKHPEDVIYQWLPAYLSRRFAECTPPFQAMLYHKQTEQLIFDRALRFYPIYFNGRYGCITEPYKGYSYAVYFSIVTRAHQPERKFLYLYTQIHRYITQPLNDSRCITSKRDGSVLLRLSQNSKGIRPFISLPITKSSFQGSIATWKKKESLSYLNYFLDHPFDLQSLLDNPAQYQNIENEICALLLYNSTFYSSYYNGKVAASGMGLPDRKQFFDLVKNTFPDLQPIKPLQEVNLPNRRGYRLPTIIIPSPIGHRIIIDCHLSDTTFQELLNQIAKMPKRFIKKDANIYKLNDGAETLVELRHRPESGVVQELDPNSPARTIRKMKASISESPDAHGALVEIEPKKTWMQNPEADPKLALRVAFAECGQLTQFLHDEREGKLTHRVKNSFLDLLSDFGIFTHNMVKGIDQQRNWLFITAYRPREMSEGRVLYAYYDGKRYLVRMEGDDGTWRTLPKFITDFGGLRQGITRKGVSKEKQPEIERIIHQVLQKTEGILTVVMDRIPLNKIYPPIQDQLLTTGDWILKRPELRLLRKRLRFLRLTKESYVPAYHNDFHGRAYSFSSGLFLSTDGTYYSLGSKPDSYKLAASYTKATNPSAQLLQPNLVELLPVGYMEAGEAENTARQLHLFRQGNLTYEKHTQDPAPLHRLQAIKKYIDAFLHIDNMHKSQLPFDKIRNHS